MNTRLILWENRYTHTPETVIDVIEVDEKAKDKVQYAFDMFLARMMDEPNLSIEIIRVEKPEQEPFNFSR